MGFFNLILATALAADLSLVGRVVGMKRDPDNQGFLVKVEGMTAQLKVVRGLNYKCLRDGLNTQQPLLFSFDAKSLKIQSCEVSSNGAVTSTSTSASADGSNEIIKN